jgi:hypothetical protein
MMTVDDRSRGMSGLRCGLPNALRGKATYKAFVNDKRVERLHASCKGATAVDIQTALVCMPEAAVARLAGN